MATVLCALIAAFTWNITTWWVGLPSSSSHALIGGLCGAALATARGNWSVLKWNSGLWPKVVVPMITSPLAGFFLGALVMFALFLIFHRFTPAAVHSVFGKLQIFSAAWMAHSHGTNDAQKTMGIITLALFTGTKAGSFDHLPGWLTFLRTPAFAAIPAWVTILCAITMAAGTAAGGWRIIRTLGHKMVKLQPVTVSPRKPARLSSFRRPAFTAFRFPLRHVISTSIMGVGAAKRFSGVKWTVVERIIWAWILTLPATGLIGFILARAVAAL